VKGFLLSISPARSFVREEAVLAFAGHMDGGIRKGFNAFETRRAVSTSTVSTFTTLRIDLRK
jgi:hypothetical protein